MKTKVYHIGGNPVVCCTIGQLSKLCGKNQITLRKWEEKGWLPPCNFRSPNIIANSEHGERLYSEKYAKLMAIEIMKVQKGIKIPHEVVQRLHQLMKEERNEYLNL